MARVAAAIAQPLPAPPGSVTCVDLTDAAVRRIVELEPCKLPLAEAVGSTTRWPAYPPRSADQAHPMFWRFPVQPIGPHDAPRHVRR